MRNNHEFCRYYTRRKELLNAAKKYCQVIGYHQDQKGFRLLHSREHSPETIGNVQKDLIDAGCCVVNGRRVYEL